MKKMKLHHILTLTTAVCLGSTMLQAQAPSTPLKAGDVAATSEKTVSTLHSTIENKAQALSAKATPQQKAAIQKAAQAGHIVVEQTYAAVIKDFANETKESALAYKNAAQKGIQNLHDNMAAKLPQAQQKAEKMLTDAAQTKE